jgi:hypothetical protein
VWLAKVYLHVPSYRGLRRVRSKKQMRKQHVIAILLLATIVLAAVPFASAAEALSKPSVTLPSNWQLIDEIAYPNAISEHDAQGAGLLQYQDPTNYDGVMIYYEKASTTTYTSAQLQSEAEAIFYRDHEMMYDESGVMTVAGVQAGYAKAYEATYDAYVLELVFVKDNYYINAYALYDANTQSENAVTSLLNSINNGGLFSGTMLLVIIGIVVAIVVVVVVVLVLKKRKKPVQIQTQNYIPPPPPAP